MKKLLEEYLSSKEAIERISILGGIDVDLNVTVDKQNEEVDSASQSPITTSSTITKPETKKPITPKKPVSA